MKKLVFIYLLVMLMSACNEKPKENGDMASENPFFTEYQTPFQVPPFDQIKNEHFKPAFLKGMKDQMAEIEAIINNTEAPDFENTIAALDYSGELLTKVSDVFFNFTSSITSDSLQAIAKDLSPLLSKHRDDISMNPDLFKRVKTVYDKKDELNLNTEQMRLLEKTYKGFVRGGALLEGDAQEQFRKINKQLSLLSLQFGENVLAEVNNWKLYLESQEDLAGLPQSLIDAYASAAKANDQEGKYLITLDKPSFIPFLQYSERRDLREKVLKAYNHIGDNNNENDNKAIVEKIVNLRVQRAHLLGYPNHSSYVLEESMAKTPENVYGLLDQVWEKALPAAQAEVDALQKMIEKDGKSFKLEAWDWWYYAEKLRKEKYDLDEEMLRPYFELNNVREGAFEVAHRLYGLTFTERTDIPVYHPDAHAYEVLDKDGSHLAVLYMDFFPRASKRGGAWMSEYRIQSKKDGKDIRPIITIVTNFSKPTGDKPALLSFEEVSTLFHEFGHGLHGMLSDCTYPSLAGTNVPRDFVECPSQIMENWCAEPEVLAFFAKHYETGEVIPQELIDKVVNSGHFNQGFVTVEYMSAAYLDMAYHTLNDTLNFETNAFETEALNKIKLIPEIVVRYRSTYFSHIFSGGYSSGYYAYLWAETLDADAFQAFKETSLFDQETATSWRNNVLSRGATDDVMNLYVKFRGKKPGIEPLLKRKGLL